MFCLKRFTTLAAVAALALPALAAAQTVTPLKVEGRAPTEVRIALVGKAPAVVKHEVRVAAETVCHNAVANRELASYDADWCSRATEARALSRYAKIVRHNATVLAAGSEIVLAVR